MSQYYLKKEQLQTIKALLPKKDADIVEEDIIVKKGLTAIQKVALRTNRSTSTVYKVLNAEFQNKEILYACCQVIIEDSERKKATALTFMQELNGTESRV